MAFCEELEVVANFDPGLVSDEDCSGLTTQMQPGAFGQVTVGVYNGNTYTPAYADVEIYANSTLIGKASGVLIDAGKLVDVNVNIQAPDISGPSETFSVNAQLSNIQNAGQVDSADSVSASAPIEEEYHDCGCGGY